jgi:hypothetical protein
MNKIILAIVILGLLLSTSQVFAQHFDPIQGQPAHGRGRVVGVVIGVRIGICPVCGQQVLIVTIRVDSDHDGDYDANDLTYEIVFHEWTEDLYNALLAALASGKPHLIEWTWEWVNGHIVRKLTRVADNPPNILYDFIPIPGQQNPLEPQIFDLQNR